MTRLEALCAIRALLGPEAYVCDRVEELTLTTRSPRYYVGNGIIYGNGNSWAEAYAAACAAQTLIQRVVPTRAWVEADRLAEAMIDKGVFHVEEDAMEQALAEGDSVVVALTPRGVVRVKTPYMVEKFEVRP